MEHPSPPLRPIAQPHGAALALQEEQDMASIRTWLRKDQQENEVLWGPWGWGGVVGSRTCGAQPLPSPQLLRQQLKELEEAAELEEAW